MSTIKVRTPNGVELTARKFDLSGVYLLISHGGLTLRLKGADPDDDVEVTNSLAASGDIEVELSADNDLWLYTNPDGKAYLDFSPKALGYEILP